MTGESIANRPLAGSADDSLGTLRIRLTTLARLALPLLAGLVVLTAFLWAVFPEVFAPRSPTQALASARLQPPGTAFLFGTDNIGRDLFSRVVHGAGVSIAGASLAVLIGLVAGCMIGVPSGYIGGRLDEVVMRVIDTLLSIPSLLLALMVVTALGPGTENAAVAVGIAAIATFARLSRTQVLLCRSETYIEAARLAGSSSLYTLARHVLPNIAPTLLGVAVLEFGLALLALAGLSFLGYGAAAPTPEWGSLVAEGRNYIAFAWWLTTLPGLVVVTLVLSLNYLSSLLVRR